MIALKLLLIVVVYIMNILPAFAYDQIPITYSGTKEKVIFDGKWSFEHEWKESSFNSYNYDDDSQIILRSAHQGDFVYLLIDAVNDQSPDYEADKAVVCFDSENNKNQIPDIDDHCFMAILGDTVGISYQGIPNNAKFIKIQNHPDFVAVSGISDENDRYSGVPHLSYEFKIPTEIIQRNSVYGFYFMVYDDHTKKYYTYPTNLLSDDKISTPDTWGEIYSPDKSLPEFYVPFLITALGFIIMIFLNRSKAFFQQI